MVVELPAHICTSGPALIGAFADIVTVTASDAEHPSEVPVTVYIVLIAGLTVIEAVNCPPGAQE